MKLLTNMANNPKTAKGLPDRDYIGRLLHLSHADTSGLGNVCPDAARNMCGGKGLPGGVDPCLDNEGRGHTPGTRLARLSRTALFFNYREKFYAQMRHELSALEARARAEQKLGLARLDGTSDLGIGQQLCAEFPSLLFFDYSKSFQRVRRHLAALEAGREQNYHLTFSLGAANMREALWCLDHGVNVSVVFKARKSVELPASWRGFDLIDGDVNDWRFEDYMPAWVGLRSKGGSYNSGSKFLYELPHTHERNAA